MSERSRILGAVVVCALLVATALGCGNNRDGETSDAADTSSTAAPDEGGALEEFGSIEFPCGPNEGGGELPTDDPNDTFGVTDAGIGVTTFSDPGFEGTPGLNQELFDAAEAFVAECNEAGGINGRPIDLHLRDAALFDYATKVEEACSEDFAVVGGGAVLDDTGAQRLTDCGLISLPGFAVTVQAGQADNVVHAVPTPVNLQPTFHFQKLIDELDEDGAGTDLTTEDVIEHAGILWGDLQTLIDFKDQVVKTTEALGFEYVYGASYNVLGESNWAPFAQTIADAGVEWLFYVGQPQFLVQLEQAMNQVGAAPAIIQTSANFYDPRYSEGIEGLNPDTLHLVTTSFWPFEHADDNPAVQAYLDLLEEHVPNADPAMLGMQGTSAWLLFAQIASACDRNNDLSRSCVFETAKAIESWDSGGLHYTSEPSENRAPSCGVFLEVGGGAFELWRPEGSSPDDAYFCPEERFVEVTGDYGEGAQRGG